jgi:hypothetical protein
MRAEERGGDFTEGEQASPAKKQAHTNNKAREQKSISGFKNKRKRKLPGMQKNSGAFTHNQVPVNNPLRKISFSFSANKRNFPEIPPQNPEIKK